ncbi:MAG TPA: HEAT repeat domain-containing protein [Gammaproteobacteria bacterium]|nr:HEAT repeat domain-containing protein [Gammaproteobacteria bacterium]
MNFLASFQAERLISQIRTNGDVHSANARKALQKLAKLGPGAIPKILDAVAYADRNQTETFTELLSGICTDKTLPFVARGLASDDPKTVKATTAALRQSTRYNVNQLVNMLGEDEYSKPAILEVLAAKQNRLNLGRLLSQVSSLDPNEQTALFKIVTEIVTEDSLPDLITRLSGRDPIVKSHLVSVISRFDNESVHKALREQLRDKNRVVRHAALTGVARMNGEFSIEAVCDLLLDSDPQIQEKAVEVIIQMNRPDTVRYLLPAMKSEDEYARRYAVEILNEIGNSDSVKFLLDAVCQDDDWWVRSRATDALGHIGGERVKKAVLELIKDKDENVRRAAIEIANTNPDKSTVDHLIAALTDDDWWVRERAADALAEIGDKRAIPALQEMLTRDDRGVPVAIGALGKLGAGDATILKQLLPYVRSQNKDIGVAAINAVTLMADDRFAEGVVTFLQKGVPADADPAVLAAAERAIQTLNTRDSMTTGPTSGLRNVASGTVPQQAAAEKTGTDVKAPALESEDINATVHTLLSELPDAAPHEPARQEEPRSDSTEPQVAGLEISALQNGDVIDGRYKFIEKIGKGAFGTVLLVEDTVVQERLILKFLNPNVASDEEMMKRFVHELRYSRRITHKNVIRIYDFLYIGGGYAISMEYFPSHTLGAEIARESPMSPAKALRYASDICTGMQIAHQQGIIHRDLKPANILINDDGLLKIVDFGVAAAASSTGDTQLTKTGYVIGSPKYMAPEQILGKKVDERADIYSLGVILYEMLCGSPPYSRGDHMSVMYQHVQGKAPPVCEANNKISQELSDVVSIAMAVDKSKRYASMLEFHTALTEAGAHV